MCSYVRKYKHHLTLFRKTKHTSHVQNLLSHVRNLLADVTRAECTYRRHTCRLYLLTAHVQTLLAYVTRADASRVVHSKQKTGPNPCSPRISMTTHRLGTRSVMPVLPNTPIPPSDRRHRSPCLPRSRPRIAADVPSSTPTIADPSTLKYFEVNVDCAPSFIRPASPSPSSRAGRGPVLP